MAKANLVITVNLACKRIFANRSCRPEKIGIVMNAPDERSSGPSQPPRVREAPEKPFVIMYHGSIVERNGLDLAIDALRVPPGRYPSRNSGFMAARHPFLERVLQSTGDQGLTDRIKLSGPEKPGTVDDGNRRLRFGNRP